MGGGVRKRLTPTDTPSHSVLGSYDVATTWVSVVLTWGHIKRPWSTSLLLWTCSERYKLLCTMASTRRSLDLFGIKYYFSCGLLQSHKIFQLEGLVCSRQCECVEPSSSLKILHLCRLLRNWPRVIHFDKLKAVFQSGNVRLLLQNACTATSYGRWVCVG